MTEGTDELTDEKAVKIALAALSQSRRAVLAGSGGVCLALLLGACGGSTPQAAATDDGSDDGVPTSSAPTDAATTDGGGDSSGVLAKVADVPEGGGKLVAGDVMLVKINGAIKAYNAHCRHQGFIVDPPKNGVIICENHGSEYKASDGSVVNGPATQPLIVINVKVEGDNIVRA